jgi:hypothetical protein
VRGQLVVLSLPGDDTARARIRQLAPALNTQTRLATVFADIESGGSARAGAYVEGRIVLGETAALIVPASSLVVRDGYSIAFKVAAGEVAQVEQQRVEVGRRKGTDVEILTGLSKGERVVTRGAGFLEDGDNVRVCRRLPMNLATWSIRDPIPSLLLFSLLTLAGLWAFRGLSIQDMPEIALPSVEVTSCTTWCGTCPARNAGGAQSRKLARLTERLAAPPDRYHGGYRKYRGAVRDRHINLRRARGC